MPHQPLHIPPIPLPNLISPLRRLQQSYFRKRDHERVQAHEGFQDFQGGLAPWIELKFALLGDVLGEDLVFWLDCEAR